MSVYTWDVLDRETGEVLIRIWRPLGAAPGVYPDEVAYCRETGEVVYLPKP